MFGQSLGKLLAALVFLICALLVVLVAVGVFGGTLPPIVNLVLFGLLAAAILLL